MFTEDFICHRVLLKAHFFPTLHKHLRIYANTIYVPPYTHNQLRPVESLSKCLQFHLYYTNESIQNMYTAVKKVRMNDKRKMSLAEGFSYI